MFYKKYNTAFDNIILEEVQGSMRFKYDDAFCEFDSVASVDALIDIVSDKVLFNIKPDRTSITKITKPGVGPHCDAWGVSLNYYLSTASGVTHFYNVKPEKAHEKISGFYTSDEIERCHSFTPAQHDLYLFNTHIVHSVDVPDEMANRYIFRFIWSTATFDQVVESIEIR